MTIDTLSRASLGALRSAGVLTPAEHELLLPKVPQEMTLTTPAAAFAWIDYYGQLPRKRVLQIRSEMAGGDREQAEILRQLLVLDQQRKAELGSFWRSMLPGPLWMWIALPLLVAGFYRWKAVGPATVPACASPEIKRSLNGMLLRAGIDARMAATQPSAAVRPSVGAVREVGYASETKVRGCVATMKIDGAEIPYAYTIAAGADGKPASITGASQAIVEARFGHLDGDGKFTNTAAPIGRAAVESVFRARVDEMKSGGPRTAPPSAERSREIADVEPIAPCREIKPGLAYSCRLLVERNDPVMAALGRSSSMDLEGDFTFQRDSETGPWTMSDRFGEEFVSAMAQSLAKATKQ